MIFNHFWTQQLFVTKPLPMVLHFYLLQSHLIKDLAEREEILIFHLCLLGIKKDANKVLKKNLYFFEFLN